MFDAYAAGQEDTLEALGLIKTAGRFSTLKRFGDWAWKKVPTARSFRRGMVGSPRTFMEEVASGRALKDKRSMLRQSFYAPDALSKTMFYGMPAIETAGIAMDDEGNKSRRIGESLGGAAMGMAMYRPLGMVGSILTDPIGRSFGGAVGQTAGYLGDKVVGSEPKKLNLGQP